MTPETTLVWSKHQPRHGRRPILQQSWRYNDYDFALMWSPPRHEDEKAVMTLWVDGEDLSLFATPEEAIEEREILRSNDVPQEKVDAVVSIPSASVRYGGNQIADRVRDIERRWSALSLIVDVNPHGLL